MPKKQQQPLYTRPSTSPHPSLSLSNSAIAAHGSTGREDNPSVSESINSLRNEEARHLSLRLPPAATVHPSLRNLLDVPEIPQPRPRPGMRTAIPSQIRRIPGPAAPPSWQLRARRHAPQATQFEHLRVQRDPAAALVHEISLPGAQCPSRRSLLHTTSRAMAERWDWHLQYDHFYLASLPLRLRETLLTYVARYATDESLERAHGTLRILFPDEKRVETEDAAHQAFLEDATEVMRLDLGRALGTWLRKTSSLKKELIRPRAPRVSPSSDLGVLPGSGRRGSSGLPDSWDNADLAPNEIVTQPSLLPSFQEPPALRFSNLVHLSLTISPSTPSPASTASWSSLLSMTSHLSTLQSLALGYWPCPTLTPHAAAASATIRNPVSRTSSRISYGGTDIYTVAESSWREAAGILRNLSRHLYCLRWLDLTGCGAWFGALSWTDMKTVDDDLGSEARLPEIGPDWNGSWRNVEYLALGVGWTPPAPEDNEQSSTSSNLPSENQESSSRSTKWLNSRLGSVTKTGAPHTNPSGLGLIKQDWDVEEERRKYFAKQDLEKFKAIQARAREVTRHMRLLRERAGGRWVQVDF